MKRNTQANDEKVLRYSLRKYKLGLASVTIGAIFLSFAAVQGVKADEAVSTPDSSTQVEQADPSLTTSGLVTETPTAPVANLRMPRYPRKMSQFLFQKKILAVLRFPS